jgi:hypothetical protein
MLPQWYHSRLHWLQDLPCLQPLGSWLCPLLLLVLVSGLAWGPVSVWVRRRRRSSHAWSSHPCSSLGPIKVGTCGHYMARSANDHNNMTHHPEGHHHDTIAWQCYTSHNILHTIQHSGHPGVSGMSTPPPTYPPDVRAWSCRWPLGARPGQGHCRAGPPADQCMRQTRAQA